MTAFNRARPISHTLIVTRSVGRATALLQDVVPTALISELSDGKGDGDPSLSGVGLGQIPHVMGCAGPEVYIKTRAFGGPFVSHERADAFDGDGASSQDGVR